MICRVCNQPISFVRGRYPGRKRKATQAIHDYEVQEILQQTHGEIVHPPSGAQRTLRIKLEANHPPVNHHVQTVEQPSAQSQIDPTAEDARDPDQLKMENQVEAGSKRMEREREQYHAVSPTLTGGDVDAAWQEAESTGEETPGGHQATPGQNDVDAIGRSFGMELEDNQETYTHEEILARRDRHRWELDRRSVEEEEEEYAKETEKSPA